MSDIQMSSEGANDKQIAEDNNSSSTNALQIADPTENLTNVNEKVDERFPDKGIKFDGPNNGGIYWQKALRSDGVSLCSGQYVADPDKRKLFVAMFDKPKMMAIVIDEQNNLHEIDINSLTILDIPADKEDLKIKRNITRQHLSKGLLIPGPMISDTKNHSASLSHREALTKEEPSLSDFEEKPKVVQRNAKRTLAENHTAAAYRPKRVAKKEAVKLKPLQTVDRDRVKAKQKLPKANVAGRTRSHTATEKIQKRKRSPSPTSRTVKPKPQPKVVINTCEVGKSYSNQNSVVEAQPEETSIQQAKPMVRRISPESADIQVAQAGAMQTLVQPQVTTIAPERLHLTELMHNNQLLSIRVAYLRQLFSQQMLHEMLSITEPRQFKY